MHPYDAESMLLKAQENARAAKMPQLEHKIVELLTKARSPERDPARVLQDVQEALEIYSDSANPDLLYSLFARQAEARQVLGQDEAALAELQDALVVLPEDALYQKTRIRTIVASIRAARFEWDEARKALAEGQSEVNAWAGAAKDVDTECSSALIDLVRANIHQALGEDDAASTLYEKCAEVFEKCDDRSFLVSALQGFVDCGFLLGYSPTRDTRARLSDYARTATEYREAKEKEQQGIVSFASGSLAQAHTELLEA